jgi:hypothetical protein
VCVRFAKDWSALVFRVIHEVGLVIFVLRTRRSSPSAVPGGTSPSPASSGAPQGRRLEPRDANGPKMAGIPGLRNPDKPNPIPGLEAVERIADDRITVEFERPGTAKVV